MLASLCGQHAFGLITVPLSFAVFLVCILNGNFFVHEVLSVHVGYRFVGGFEIRERDEAITFGQICLISSNLDMINVDVTENGVLRRIPLVQLPDLRIFQKYHRGLVP